MYLITALRLIVLLIISTVCLNRVVMGIPVPRQSITDQDDIIAGQDFVSILSSLRKPQQTTVPAADTPTDSDDLLVDNTEQLKTIIRDSRSSLYTLNTSYGNVEQDSDGITISVPLSFPADYYSTETSINNDPNINQEAINNFLQIDGINNVNTTREQFVEGSSTILSILKSIPIDSKISNKNVWRDIDIFSNHTDQNINKNENTGTLYNTQQIENNENNSEVFADQQVTNLNLASQNNHFAVEETDPITINNAAHPHQPPVRYSSGLHHDSSEFTVPFGANRDYLEQQREREEKRKQESNHPYHQTVIYHGHSRDGSRARSVSYSSIIQNVKQNQPEPRWETAETIERPGYVVNSPHVNVKKSDDVETTHLKQHQQITQTSPEKDDIFGDFLSNKNNNQNKEFAKTNDNLSPSSQTITESTIPTSTKYHYEHPYQEQNWEEPEKVYGQPEKPTQPISSTIPSSEENGWSVPEKNYEVPEQKYGQSSTQKENNFRSTTTYGVPELNYEVDEAVSVMTNGRTHGIQSVNVPKENDNHKVGYVVEGRNYRKYRVEERTSDGFIVGEYGVVSHDDGSLRGVRYAADGTINPRLIYDALMKFLSL